MAGSLYSTVFGGGGGSVQGNAQYAEGAVITAGTSTGLKIGGSTAQKVAMWAATPVVQPSGTGELVGLNGNAATNVNATNMNSNGNSGTKSYTLTDLVKALKAAGILAAS